jgi:hypothetical protein
MPVRIDRFGQRLLLVVGRVEAVLEGFAHLGTFLLSGDVPLHSSLFSPAREKMEGRVLASSVS